MSEQITHLGIAADARLFALASPRVCSLFKEVLRDHQEAMHLGALTRRSETFAGTLLRTLRDRWPEARPDDPEKLAFCLGTFTHRAADRMMKPVFVAQTQDGRYARNDISIYHDACVFRRVFAHGARAPYTPRALETPLPPPAAGVDMAALETLFRVLLQRGLLAAHTLKPDDAHPDAWLSDLFGRLQEMTIDLRAYHQALSDPDPELVRRAVTDVNFYNEGDALLELAARLRSGETVSGAAFLQAYRLEDRASLYARALSAAYGYLHVASEFWEGQAREELLLDAVVR